MKIIDYLRELKARWRPQGQISYAQTGEDVIVFTLLQGLLKIESPVYLDIGAHHPTYLSNTYYMYRKGCSGVCVEPDPTLFDVIRRRRPRDLCLNVGVGEGSGKVANFYVMTSKTLSTFSREEAESQVKGHGEKIEQIIPIPLLSIEEILTKHLQRAPHFVSLDTEGLDLTILKGFDFERYRPEVFCVETLTHPDERKLTEIFSFMEGKNYLVFADTYINTIFVERKAWEKRGLKETLRLRA